MANRSRRGIEQLGRALVGRHMTLREPEQPRHVRCRYFCRVLLRKLWAKMSEPDWRTVSKAVYLFHSILRDLPVEHHAILKIFLGKVIYFAKLPCGVTQSRVFKLLPGRY